MGTMKIVLLVILLVSGVAKNSAKWTSSQAFVDKIDSLQSNLAEQKVKQDMLNLLNSEKGKNIKILSADELSSEQTLEMLSKLRMAAKRKRVPKEPARKRKKNNYFGKSQKKFKGDDNATLKKKKYIHHNRNEYANNNLENVNLETSESSSHISIEGKGPQAYVHNNLNENEKEPFTQLDNIDSDAQIEKDVVIDAPAEILSKRKNQHQGHISRNVYLKLKRKLYHLLEQLEQESKFRPSLRFGFVSFYYRTLKTLIHIIVGSVKSLALREKEEEKQKVTYNQRLKRDTQAGYTQDPDTCKKYHKNLEKMWATLSKQINSTGSLNEQALHNIAVIVEAYLDHQNKHPREAVKSHQEKKHDKISIVLKKIKKLLGTNNATDKVKEIVLENFKPEYEAEDPDCKQTNEDNLFSSIALSYKNYLDNAKCRGDYDTGLLRGKALLRGGEPPNSKAVSKNNFHDSYIVDKTNINEAESSEEFNRGRSLGDKRSKKRSRFNQRITKRSLRHLRLYRDARLLKGRSSPSILRRKHKKTGKKKSPSHKKSRVRTDESCVKYANRKFLITLRMSIERFMDLRDCQHDDTLRTSNNNKTKSFKSYSKKPILRISDEQYFNYMKDLADTHISKTKDTNK